MYIYARVYTYSMKSVKAIRYVESCRYRFTMFRSINGDLNRMQTNQRTIVERQLVVSAVIGCHRPKDRLAVGKLSR